MPPVYMACVFNKTHVVLEKNYLKHIFSCQKKYPCIKIEHCPYNLSHVELVKDFPEHLLICPDKQLIENPEYVLAPLNPLRMIENKIKTLYEAPFPNPKWHSPRWYKQHIIELSQMGRPLPPFMNKFKVSEDIGYTNGGPFRPWIPISTINYDQENLFNYGVSYENTVRQLDGKKRFCPAGWKSRQDVGYKSGIVTNRRSSFGRLNIKWKDADEDRFND